MQFERIGNRMIEMDLEDYLEEVKYQMTEYDILEEDIIKEWEVKARKWTKDHFDRKIMVRRGDDLLLLLKNEDIMEDVAQKFYKAVKEDNIKGYWYRFKLLG